MKKINKKDQNSAIIAVDFLKKGKIISFATDTVYGLAVDASNSEAINKLYDIKNRDKNKPIAIFVKDLESAKKIFIFNDLAQKIAEKFLPGALTLVLKKNDKALIFLAKNLNNNSEFLGFRIVEDEFIKKLLNEFGGILAVTSANISGQNAAISSDEVEESEIKEKIDLLIDGGICDKKIPSTVLKIEEQNLVFLRKGALDEKLIKSINE